MLNMAYGNNTRKHITADFFLNRTHLKCQAVNNISQVAKSVQTAPWNWLLKLLKPQDKPPRQQMALVYVSVKKQPIF